MIGTVLLFVAFALVTGWVAKTAEGRGRNAFVWGALAAVVGLVGFALGFGVLAQIPFGRDATIAFELLLGLAPAVLMLTPMFLIASLVRRSGFAKTRKREWPVHIVQHGTGTLRVEADRFVLAWDDGSREVPRRELAHVEADGECVRVKVKTEAEETDYALLPIAKRLAPEGRRDLSKQIAMRLVAP